MVPGVRLPVAPGAEVLPTPVSGWLDAPPSLLPVLLEPLVPALAAPVFEGRQFRSRSRRVSFAVLPLPWAPEAVSRHVSCWPLIPCPLVPAPDAGVPVVD
jgi:hypothetical protein